MTNYNLFIQSKLPNILNLEELLNYFEKYHKGDQEAREIIINHNLKLVINRVLIKFLNTPYDTNELVSVGIIGLIKGVDTFDINKKINFSTYAIRCIDNEILMFLRKNKKHLKVDSLDQKINIEEKKLELKDTLLDNTQNLVKDYEKKESYQILYQVIEKLNKRDQQIITLAFGLYNQKPETQKQIAKKLNVSQSQVSRLIKQILKILKKELEKNPKLTQKEKGKKAMPRKTQTIYEYFNQYSKIQINQMIESLSEEEKKIFNLRFGNDLEKEPQKNDEWNNEQRDLYYGKLLPKMKRILKNATKENKNIEQKTSKVLLKMQSVSSPNNESTKQNYQIICQMLQTQNFFQLLSSISLKEAIIFTLKFGCINGKIYSNQKIAEFLELEEKEVLETTKKILLLLKENINQLIDHTITNENSRTL